MLLLTGFDPFGTVIDNPSFAVAAELAARRPDERRAVQLPTSYARATELLTSTVEELRPDAVVLFGHAAGASGLRIESVAANLDSADKPDNDGVVGAGRPIEPGADEALRPPYDCEALARHVLDSGGSAWVSYDAGGFVCNHSYFRALRLTGRALFVHVSDASPETVRSAELLLDGLS